MKRLVIQPTTLIAVLAGSLFLLLPFAAEAQQAAGNPPLPVPPSVTSPNPNPPATSPTPTNPLSAVPLPGPSDSANAAAPASPNGEPGFLGMVTDDRQEKGAGVRVLDVENGAPADKGGLKTHDLITSINGNAIHSESDMISVMQGLGPGSKVAFSVDRDGQQATVNVTLGTRPPVGQRRFEQFGKIPEQLPEPNQSGGQGPESPIGAPSTPSLPRGESNAGPGESPDVPAGPAAPSGPVPPNAYSVPTPPENGGQYGNQTLSPVAPSRRPLLGVRTSPVSEEVQQRLNLPSDRGALVVMRTDGGPAARAGIPLGAVITAVDGRPVDSPPDLTALIGQAGAGHAVEISYFYRGTERRAKVRLGDFAGADAGPLPTPPSPEAGQLPAPSDKARIDALERRVEQLEHRIDDLQQELHRLR